MRPGLGQLPTQRTGPPAARQQARGLGPAARPAELLGPGDHQSLVGPELEDAGHLGLAVGFAAELAVDRRAFLMQRCVFGPGGDQAVEIPEGLGPALGRGAVDHAVSSGSRAPVLASLAARLAGSPRRTCRTGQTAAHARARRARRNQSSGRAAIRRSRCQIAAKALPFCSASRIIGSCQAGSSSGCTAEGSRRPSCSSRSRQAGCVEPRDRRGPSPMRGRCGPRSGESGRRRSNPEAARAPATCETRPPRRWRRRSGHQT